MIFLTADGRRRISLCNINYSPEGLYHPDRIMEEYDLLYMVNGSWNIMEDNTCHHVEKGQLLILEPGHHHYSLEKCSPHMRNMYIHCSFLPGDGHPSPDCLRIQKITDCAQKPEIENLFLRIIETYWSEQEHTDLRLTALLELLLAELALPEKEKIALTDNLVKNVIHDFYTCPERFFSPRELAAAHNVSIRTLSGRFKAATGFSIHQYQLALKLNLAHEQLPLNPDRSIRDIALSFGFYDEFHFSKLYKRQFGYSPSVRRGNVH